MYKDQLTTLGLTKDQATVYEFLVQHGSAQASRIAKSVGLTRPLVYKILGDLERIGLIEKKDASGEVTKFSLTHPHALQKLLESKKVEVEASENALESVMGKIMSDYNLQSGKPGVRFFVGEKGFQEIYKDITNSNQEILLIRPAYEDNFNKLLKPIISDFIKTRVRKNIKATAITPSDTFRDTTDLDKKMHYDRTWVPMELYNSPVEINIYGDKMALLSYSQELVGVIIESPQIAKAMKQIFELARMGASSTNSTLASPKST
jgi:sugar-specific transcriptional regulator TrmB